MHVILYFILGLYSSLFYSNFISSSLLLSAIHSGTHSKYVHNNLPGIKSPTASRIVAQYQAPDPRHKGFASSSNDLAAIDPFYGPILMKIDTIFAQLGVNDEACKERLLCSMYKNPTQYSPHSNFISAELSRWEEIFWRFLFGVELMEKSVDWQWLFISFSIFCRDVSELKRAPSPNVAVTRFYRYIQAARDGQDHRDCLSVYNLCSINTEQRRKR